MVVVYLIFEKMLELYFFFCVLIFDQYFTTQDVDCWYIFGYKWYANDIVFNISDMKYLLKWFV